MNQRRLEILWNARVLSWVSLEPWWTFDSILFQPIVICIIICKPTSSSKCLLIVLLRRSVWVCFSNLSILERIAAHAGEVATKSWVIRIGVIVIDWTRRTKGRKVIWLICHKHIGMLRLVEIVIEYWFVSSHWKSTSQLVTTERRMLQSTRRVACVCSSGFLVIVWVSEAVR